MNKQQSIQMVIARIDKSENINKKYNIQVTKHFLKKRITNFKLEDYGCYASDGNTALEPDVYYSKITHNQELEMLDSVETQLFHHTCEGDNTKRVKFESPELGTNLLRCCEECVDLWLKTMFHFNFIKHMFHNSIKWFMSVGRSLQICLSCDKSEMCAIHYQKERWCCQECFK